MRIGSGHTQAMQIKFFEDRAGFTFTQGVPSATDLGENYYDVSIDDKNFQNTQYNHYQLAIKHNLFVDRNIPEAEESIFAGMNQ